MFFHLTALCSQNGLSGSKIEMSTEPINYFTKYIIFHIQEEYMHISKKKIENPSELYYSNLGFRGTKFAAAVRRTAAANYDAVFGKTKIGSVYIQCRFLKQKVPLPRREGSLKETALSIYLGFTQLKHESLFLLTVIF
jgi:hypothetical protein